MILALAFALVLVGQDEVVQTRRVIPEGPVGPAQTAAPSSGYTAHEAQDCMMGGVPVACPRPAPSPVAEAAPIGPPVCSFGGRRIAAPGCDGATGQPARVFLSDAPAEAVVEEDDFFNTPAEPGYSRSVAAQTAAEAAEDAPVQPQPRCHREQRRNAEGTGFTVETICGDDEAGRRDVQEMLDRQPH